MYCPSPTIYELTLREKQLKEKRNSIRSVKTNGCEEINSFECPEKERTHQWLQQATLTAVNDKQILKFVKKNPKMM